MKYFYTLSSRNGAFLLGCDHLIDFDTLCREAVAAVGNDIAAVFAYLQGKHGLDDVRAPRQFDLDEMSYSEHLTAADAENN